MSVDFNADEIFEMAEQIERNGVKFYNKAAKGFKVLVEYSNFNTGNMKDATDLMVADGTLENALLLGVKARF